jgi:hypothetical protein
MSKDVAVRACLGLFRFIVLECQCYWPLQLGRAAARSTISSTLVLVIQLPLSILCTNIALLSLECVVRVDILYNLAKVDAALQRIRPKWLRSVNLILPARLKSFKHKQCMAVPSSLHSSITNTNTTNI